MPWQLQEAKAKFSELVQKTLDEGPQTVTRRGKEVGRRAVGGGLPEALGAATEPARGPDVRSAKGELELPPRVVQEREIEW